LVAEVLGCFNPRWRYIHTSQAEATPTQIEAVSPDTTAHVQDETTRRKARFPFDHAGIGRGKAGITWGHHPASPDDFPARPVICIGNVRHFSPYLNDKQIMYFSRIIYFKFSSLLISHPNLSLITRVHEDECATLEDGII